MAEEWAYLIDGGKTLLARASLHRHEPDSAVLRLVGGIYRDFPRDALRLLRKRVSVSGSMTPWDFGLLKVTAKRWKESSSLPSEEETIALGTEASTTDSAEPSKGESGRDCVERLLRENMPNSSLPLHARPRGIAAAIQDASGTAVMAAMNGASLDRTRHAEIELLRKWWKREGRPLPSAYRVISSLKPCRMCAGFLWKASENPNALSVEFLQWDPGPLARSTILDPESYERRVFGRGVIGSLETRI